MAFVFTVKTQFRASFETVFDDVFFGFLDSVLVAGLTVFLFIRPLAIALSELTQREGKLFVATELEKIATVVFESNH